MNDAACMEECLSFVVPREGITRLDVWLASCCKGFSRARLQGLMKAGRVTRKGVPIMRAMERMFPGDVVNVCIPPPVPAVPEPEAISLSILYEDEDILVLNKPAGLVVHPAPGHLTGTLVNALLHHCPKLTGIGGVARPGIVHRLDQDTSGAMVVAKSQRAMDVLTREFASHMNVHKTYLAITHGIPSPAEGRLVNLIGRAPYDRKKMAIVTRNGKEAVTNYRMLTHVAYSGGMAPLACVQCKIETGRTHQIRVHLASVLRCPIVGDGVYGRPSWDKCLPFQPERQLLHAWQLALKHPITRVPLVFESPLPADFPDFAHAHIKRHCAEIQT